VLVDAVIIRQPLRPIQFWALSEQQSLPDPADQKGCHKYLRYVMACGLRAMSFDSRYNNNNNNNYNYNPRDQVLWRSTGYLQGKRNSSRLLCSWTEEEMAIGLGQRAQRKLCCSSLGTPRHTRIQPRKGSFSDIRAWWPPQNLKIWTWPYLCYLMVRLPLWREWTSC